MWHRLVDWTVRRAPEGECTRAGCRQHGPYGGRCADDRGTTEQPRPSGAQWAGAWLRGEADLSSIRFTSTLPHPRKGRSEPVT